MLDNGSALEATNIILTKAVQGQPVLSIRFGVSGYLRTAPTEVT